MKTSDAIRAELVQTLLCACNQFGERAEHQVGTEVGDARVVRARDAGEHGTVARPRRSPITMSVSMPGTCEDRSGNRAQ